MALGAAERREAGQRSQRGYVHGKRKAVAGRLLMCPGDDPGVVGVAGELAAIRHRDGQHDLIARPPSQLARSRIHRPAGRRYRLLDAQPGGLSHAAAARDHAGNGRYGHARTVGHLGDRRRPIPCVQPCRIAEPGYSSAEAPALDPGASSLVRRPLATWT